MEEKLNDSTPIPSGLRPEVLPPEGEGKSSESLHRPKGRGRPRPQAEVGGGGGRGRRGRSEGELMFGTSAVLQCPAGFAPPSPLASLGVLPPPFGREKGRVRPHPPRFARVLPQRAGEGKTSSVVRMDGRAIKVTRSVQSGADHLWSVISTPGYLEACHPFCARNDVQHWPGVGAADTIAYYGGRIVQRHFVAWEEGTGYDLVVTNADGANQAAVSWRIDPEGESASRLTVTLQPHFLDQMPRALRWLTYLGVRSRMRRYLESAVAGVVHHAETGRRVARNQFGPHPWFSPAVES